MLFDVALVLFAQPPPKSGPPPNMGAKKQSGIGRMFGRTASSRMATPGLVRSLSTSHTSTHCNALWWHCDKPFYLTYKHALCWHWDKPFYLTYQHTRTVVAL